MARLLIDIFDADTRPSGDPDAVLSPFPALATLLFTPLLLAARGKVTEVMNMAAVLTAALIKVAIALALVLINLFEFHWHYPTQGQYWNLISRDGFWLRCSHLHSDWSKYFFESGSCPRPLLLVEPVDFFTVAGFLYPYSPLVRNGDDE